jgi:DNA-directed RNA polymerase specialized sigma24 family protein
MQSMDNTDDSDGSLVARHAHGDAEAFELLYRRHEMRTWRYLERNVGNRAAADELLQQVWFAVSKGLFGPTGLTPSGPPSGC